MLTGIKKLIQIQGKCACLSQDHWRIKLLSDLTLTFTAANSDSCHTGNMTRVFASGERVP